jgi:hypothetical protein
MQSELLGANVVIVAKQFNPSVFSQLWLVRNEIVKEDEFLEGCIFSDDISKIETSLFGLLVLPPQLQFLPRSPEGEAELIEAKLGKIIAALPHTPYVAIGFNFSWHVWPEDGNLHQLSRSLFLNEYAPLAKKFGAEDALFGAYVSQNIGDCRLRLDVKPVDYVVNDQQTRRLHFAFNFQLDLSQTETPVESIIAHLSKWEQFKNEASEVIDLIEDHKE